LRLNRVHEISRGASSGALDLLCSVTTFDLDADRPDKAEQFSTYGHDDFLFGFVSGEQCAVARVQAMLCSPGDRFDRLALLTVACRDAPQIVPLVAIVAHQLDDRNPEIRSTLRDLLIERARNLHDTDWQACEALAQEALELDPNHPEARSLRTQAFDRKREEFVEQVASQARRLQASGDMKAAAAEDSLPEKLCSIPPAEIPVSLMP